MRKIWDALCDSLAIIIGSLVVGAIVLLIWGLWISFTTGWFTAATVLGALDAGRVVASALLVIGLLGRPIAGFLELTGSMMFVIVFDQLYED